MSRRNRKQKHKQAELLENKAEHNKYLWLLLAVILAAIPFSMGKYIEFNTAGAFDSGSYVYSAKHVLDGAKIGVDERPSAQIGTLLVNMLGVAIFGFNETGSEIIQMLLQLAALAAMLFTIRKIFGRTAAVISTVVAAAFLSSPLIAKFGNVKEQYMIAVMVLGICCYVQKQLTNKWYWAFACGAILIWAPLFKQTGLSAIIAVGVFTLVKPVLKHGTVKQMFAEIGQLLAGVFVSLLPVYLWLIIWHDGNNLPYKFIWDMLPFAASASGINSSYIADARKQSDFSTQFTRVMRYYGLLILPISLAIFSIVFCSFRKLLSLRKTSKLQLQSCEKFVLLFAVWWFCDMAFVWISPRSYEQYYLPLNASAAMCGGYIIWLYARAFTAAKLKSKWLGAGIFAIFVMAIMSWHVFFGISTSPHSGQKYGSKQRGFVPRLQEISRIKSSLGQTGWEAIGRYIKDNSTVDDKIYVWGWFPGIYVQAQRLSPASHAFTSEMHVKSPQQLSEMVSTLLSEFKKQMPLFIVDSHKSHYPWNRPPLELWPTIQGKNLPNEPAVIAQYEKQYKQMLAERVGDNEDLRFDAMKPFRDFVMSNYEPVKSFGSQIIYRLKKDK